MGCAKAESVCYIRGEDVLTVCVSYRLWAIWRRLWFWSWRSSMWKPSPLTWSSSSRRSSPSRTACKSVSRRSSHKCINVRGADRVVLFDGMQMAEMNTQWQDCAEPQANKWLLKIALAAGEEVKSRPRQISDLCCVLSYLQSSPPSARRSRRRCSALASTCVPRRFFSI